MAILRDGRRLGAALWVVLASAAMAAAPQVTVQPAKVILGVDSKVELEVRAGDVSHLKAYANTGTLAPRQLAGPNAVRFTWTPPDIRYPRMAILLFWVERGAGAPEIAVARIPLIGRTELEVVTEPRAEVRVEIGGRTFGPRRADARGQAKVPVEVPPGVLQAKVLSEVGGQSTSVMVPLDVPASNRLAAVAGPEPLPSSGGWAWLVSADQLDLQALQVEASGGAITLARSGRDSALFSVLPSPDARNASITFRTTGAADDLATVGVGVAEPPAAQPRNLTSLLLTPGAMMGATYGGGSNLSLFASLALDFSFPTFGTGLSAGLALEGHTMGLSTQVLGQAIDSWVVTFSPLAVARVQLAELGAAALHVRVGAGPLFFLHQVRSQFQPSFSERGLAPEAFAGVQLSYRVGPLDLLLDLRASLGMVQSSTLSANIGGMVLGVGARTFR